MITTVPMFRGLVIEGEAALTRAYKDRSRVTRDKSGAAWKRIAQPLDTGAEQGKDLVDAGPAAGASLATLNDVLHGPGTVGDAPTHRGLGHRAADADVHGTVALDR